jgi:DNA-directed RNA polymerase specialized sigma24 family protein
LAEERRNRAEVEYLGALARAAAVEAKAWQTLLAIPGVTAQTAATLCGVSVATVHRRVKETSHG